MFATARIMGRMVTGKPSKTAESAAAFRAREALKPEGERVCSDPLARHFIGPFYLAMGRFPWLARWFRGRGEKRFPGLGGAIVARTRYIDEHTVTCLASGVRQVVILGAGYDTRAYRLLAPAQGVKVFEVDHPATQTLKLAKLREVLGNIPGHVEFVPVDLGRDDLAKRLVEAGYDRGSRTLFIWEGVSYYLPAAVVDRTLAFIARHSAAGSAVLFDFFPRSVIDGTSRRKEAIALRKAVQDRGEPLLFGLDDAEVVPFLRARGLETLEVVGAAACKDAWFHGASANTAVSDIFRFAHAVRINAITDVNQERDQAAQLTLAKEES